MSDEVKELLISMISSPNTKDRKRKIIFWYDPKEEYLEYVNDLVFDDVEDEVDEVFNDVIFDGAEEEVKDEVDECIELEEVKDEVGDIEEEKKYEKCACVPKVKIPVKKNKK